MIRMVESRADVGAIRPTCPAIIGSVQGLWPSLGTPNPVLSAWDRANKGTASEGKVRQLDNFLLFPFDKLLIPWNARSRPARQCLSRRMS